MKRILLVLFAVLWGASLSTGCLADVSAANQNEAVAAFNAVDALARQTRAQGGLPRWSNPEHAKVLARFWNEETTLGKPPYRSSDVPTLIAISGRAGALFGTYLRFAPQGGTAPDIAANTTEYQDEVARGGAYLLRVEAIVLEAVADFIKTLPPAEFNQNRREAFQRIRLGIAGMIVGIVQMVGSPGLSPANRDILLTALGAGAEIMAPAAPLPQRAAVAEEINRALPGLSGTARQKALTIKAAFERGGCEGLCAVEAQ